jgi:two-component system, sensor histidine kinase
MWQTTLEKLSLDIDEHNLPVRAAQIRIRLNEYTRMVFSQMFLAVLMLALLWEQITHSHLQAWIAALYTAHAFELWSVWRYRNATHSVAECRAWRNRFVLFTCLTGAIMGSAGVLMYVPHDVAYQALLICILLGLSAGAVTVNPVFPASMYLYTLLVILPVTASAYYVGDAAHLILATMLLLFLTFILHAGNGLAKTFALSLQRGEENTQLVAQLTAEKQAANLARRTAERSDRSKSKFLAAASHDLRQPMHALTLFVASLKPHVLSPAGIDLLGKVEHSVDVLGNMFDALLDVSRLDAGIIEPCWEVFSVQNLFAQMALEFNNSAQEKNLQLNILSCKTSVYSDPLLLERILRNLLANALRYTEQGSITLRAQTRGQILCIEVLDTGIGIASEHAEHIFEEYFQVGNSQRDRKHGLGLGLAIVYRLSKLLQSPVKVESTLGKGSCFSVQVPLTESDVMIQHAVHKKLTGSAP